MRKVLKDDGYVFCGNEPETIEHVLLWCPHAKATWCSSPFKLQSTQHRNIGIQGWLAHLVYHLSRESFELVLVLLWSIWKARNELVWKCVVIPPQEIPIKAHTWLLEFKKWNVVQPKTKITDVQKWRKSEKGWLKCNFDGAWDEHRVVGGVRVVIRDTNGEFVATTTLKLEGITVTLLAETTVAREAALFVQQWWTQKVILKGDALLVIAAIQNGMDVNHGPFGHALSDVCTLLQPFQQWKAQFVGREANSVAHRLARRGLMLEWSVSWFEEPPNVISYLLLEDKLNS